jgi:2-polyprenyl-6-methoxyphenol hydroxylase-like FAD-dependent oxidoreductase
VEITLDFGSEHGTADFDVIVGADGAWSRVRPLLTAVKPNYSGVQVLSLTIRHITDKYPHLADLVGPGTYFALGHRQGIVSHRSAQDSSRLYVAISTPDEKWPETSGFADKTAAEVKDRLLGEPQFFAPWGAVTKELLATGCDEETKDNPGKSIETLGMYMLPVGHRWDPQPGATLIGDAAHLMTPWGGEGVNLAMWDALDLSRVIAEACATNPSDAASFQKVLAPLLAAFESAMFERTRGKAEMTWMNGQTIFGENGATRMADVMKMFGGEEG